MFTDNELFGQKLAQAGIFKKIFLENDKIAQDNFLILCLKPYWVPEMHGLMFAVLCRFLFWARIQEKIKKLGLKIKHCDRKSQIRLAKIRKWHKYILSSETFNLRW